MSLPKVLLHIGLPKTATSSLQHNVFQELHDEKRINFLGKCLDYDYKTGRVEIFNYSGKFIRDFAEGNLRLKEARQNLGNVLERDLLNVFSDEGIMVAYPGKQNLPLKEKFQNLSNIFEDCEVKVVVTLRDPIDYLYSLYVQLYPEFFSKISDLNSIQKYVERLIRNPNDVLFESFFFRRWLPILKQRFDLTVFEYEKLSSKNPSVYEGWANLVSLHPEEFKVYFDSRKVNAKAKKGKEVNKVGDLKVVENRFRQLLLSDKRMFVSAKWAYDVSGLRKIFNYRFSSNVKHKYPESDQYYRLQKLLS